LRPVRYRALLPALAPDRRLAARHPPVLLRMGPARPRERVPLDLAPVPGLRRRHGPRAKAPGRRVSPDRGASRRVLVWRDAGGRRWPMATTPGPHHRKFRLL